MAHTSTPFGLPLDDLNLIIQAVGDRWEPLRGQKLLLTGGTGFIGKWMLGSFLHANRSLGLGAQVVVLSRDPEAFLDTFPALREATEITWLAGDVRNFPLDAARGCSWAIHAATDVVATSSPAEILDTCAAGTQRVIDALSQSDSPARMLLLSSGAVYGRTPPDLSSIPEHWAGAPDPLSPASAYGEGKRVSELLCAMAASSRPGLEVSIARCFAFVGPHLPLDKHFAIGNFIGAALQGKDILIQGDGTPLRSYLYAADLAHWLWVMLMSAPSGKAFNVGGEQALSIGELAHMVRRVLGSAGEVRIAQTPKPSVSPQAYVPSIDRIASDLALIPSVGLEEAILRTARWAEQASQQ